MGKVGAVVTTAFGQMMERSEVVGHVCACRVASTAEVALAKALRTALSLARIREFQNGWSRLQLKDQEAGRS